MAFLSSLRTKIYFSMLAIILISFAVTFGITIYDQKEQNELFNDQRFLRKEDAVRKSMDYVLAGLDSGIPQDSLVAAFSDKVCELAEVHRVFIALFDLRGQYKLSSNFMLMDSLEIPETVNYTILKQLSTGNNRAFTDKNFGGGQYVLAYWYFTDAKGKPLLVTNVVYEKSNDRLSELNKFLKELAQSYVLVFMLAAIVAYLLSRYITRSLATITKRLGYVELGKHNEPIEWKEKDEIGALVKEYNRMLHELDLSAEKLARSERESAWREMAQQVAHEIKNPLTPMKLRMQQLVKTWDNRTPDFDEKLKNFSQSMIEQIDALTRIANEFSHFAKMPKPQVEPVDVYMLTKSVVDLYSEKERTRITCRIVNPGNKNLMLDRDQTIRVLNNLITNAIQAVPSDREAIIDVCARGTKSGVLIRVNDNGTGISESQRSKIFVPNFTTKSTGTGLGLAMVRSMVSHVGGSVYFRSREGKGASFFVFFPYSA
jgi:two-component system nitrogen regulation sensor histidine kinase NtrY